MIDDEKIIEMFFERSEQGMRELDIKYGKVCHKLSYHIVGNRWDAEECVNDAYLGAWNAIPPARPNPLLSYLVKIVRNISLKIYWRKEAAKRSSHYTIALEEIEACIAAPNTVEAEIDARELARSIESFLDTLTTENRVIFMRRYQLSVSKDKRLSGTWTLEQYEGQYRAAMYAAVKSANPNWKPGQKFDTSILDNVTRESVESTLVKNGNRLVRNSIDVSV